MKEKWMFWKKRPDGEKTRPYSFLVVLFSVFVALVLWFYVQEAEAPDYKKTFTEVPVTLQSLSSSFSVIEGGESRVDITLIGKRSDLNKLKASDLEAYLDLGGITRSGHYQPEISVMVPEGTELFSCFPKMATLYVDQTVSVTVPILVELGEYTVGDDIVVEAKSAVQSISVKGPKSVLDQIDHAKVKTGDLGEITESHERNLGYTLYDQNDEEISSRHVITPEKNVRVDLMVYKTRTLPLKVKAKNGWWKEEDYRYTVSPENVVIKGEPALVDSLESITALEIDERSVDGTRANYTLTPDQLLLPEGILLAETVGDVKVSLTLNSNGARTLRMKLDSGHVAVTPPDTEGLSYRFEGTSLNFKIRGNYDTLYDAALDDFYLNIDLSQFSTPGTYDVPVQIVQTSATEGKYYPVGEYQVKITITRD